jgi:putative endopeptidase
MVKRKKLQCGIPIHLPASSSSSYKQNNQLGNDFYTWVNKEWLAKTEIPSYRPDFGVSEEVERCIFTVSEKILADVQESSYRSFFKELRESCLTRANQKESVEYLKTLLSSVHCIHDVDGVVEHLAIFAKTQFSSFLNLEYHIEPDKTLRLFLNGNSPGLHYSHYENTSKMKKYKAMLRQLGELLGTPNIDKIFHLEKMLVFSSENLWNEEKLKLRGSQFPNKFPGFPWKLWFETLGIKEWKSMIFYYNSPRWIRFFTKTLHSVPIEYWKLYIARCYILNSIKYLPAPFDDIDHDFFGKELGGQQEKMPQDHLFVNTVYEYLADEYSKLFWERVGEEELVPEIKEFSKTLVEAAKRRLEVTEWLEYKTRRLAIQKVDHMLLSTVRPKAWAPTLDIPLDQKNLLKNIFLLGERNVRKMYTRIGHPYKYWEEGIFRVNAYYFNENNEMMIPYGTCISPFYSRSMSLAWNYGGLGAIIGHEMCHGFDEDGKEYDQDGYKKRWWTRGDRQAYKNRIKDLVKLFSKQIVEHKHVNGKRTVSENIADLGGLAISLQALKDALQEDGIVDPERVKEELKVFFISFATSWRTKTRHKRMRTALDTDVHAPAHLRVNLIVAQFDEWYSAFDISEDAKLYIAPKDRIRIF